MNGIDQERFPNPGWVVRGLVGSSIFYMPRHSKFYFLAFFSYVSKSLRERERERVCARVRARQRVLFMIIFVGAKIRLTNRVAVGRESHVDDIWPLTFFLSKLHSSLRPHTYFQPPTMGTRILNADRPPPTAAAGNGDGGGETVRSFTRRSACTPNKERERSLPSLLLVPCPARVPSVPSRPCLTHPPILG